MRGKVLLMKRNFGETKVFESMKEASEELGVSSAAICMAVRNKGTCCGARFSWVRRIYVAKMLSGSYVVCASGNGGELVDMSTGNVIRRGAIKEKKEITASMWI